MGDIFTNLKRTFNSGNILAKLIYINVGLFVIIRLASVILMLFNLGGFPFLQYLQVPSSPELLLYRPWTIITYMFTHFDFLHILFNMLWLYWFGGLFLTFFSERQLGGLYLLGGIAGAVLFLVAYNIFPYFRTVAAYSYLMGASASVMAIVFAVSFYRKDLEIGLFLIVYICDRLAGYYIDECRRSYRPYRRGVVRHLVCRPDQGRQRSDGSYEPLT